MVDVVAAGRTPVSELVEDEVVTVPPDLGLIETAETLVDADIGAVLVKAEGTVVGVLSERDVVRAVAQGRDLAATSAREMASTALIWCDVGATVAEVAAEMMERYVRHVLVESDGALVGVVSARDLLGVYVTAEPAGD